MSINTKIWFFIFFNLIFIFLFHLSITLLMAVFLYPSVFISNLFTILLIIVYSSILIYYIIRKNKIKIHTFLFLIFSVLLMPYFMFYFPYGKYNIIYFLKNCYFGLQ